MSRDTDQKRVPLGDREQLLDYFRAGFKPLDGRGVGMEHEKFGFISGPDGALVPLPYTGGIEVVMREMVERFGWTPILDAGHVTALEREGAAVTLEPGGQFELSGAVFAHLSNNDAELCQHLREVAEVSQPLGISWLLAGAQPLHTREQIPWMPKSRYRIMADYLPTRGDLAHEMMKMTCTVQANFDYTSEGDALEMMRLAFLISPIVSAMFASGPFRHGAPSGDVSRRNRIWTRTDPDRAGYIPRLLEPGASFDDYIDYLLDVPMISMRRPSAGYIDMSRFTFGRFLEEGHGEWTAEMADWEMHLSTLWPEVRMKRYIEVRSAAAVPPALMMSMAALWKGVLYSDAARRDVFKLFDGRDLAALHEVHEAIIKEGLAASFNNTRSVLDVARALTQIARHGLAEQRVDGLPDEADLLDALDRAVLTPGRSLAEQQLIAVRGGASVLEALEPLWLIKPNESALRGCESPANA